MMYIIKYIMSSDSDYNSGAFKSYKKHKEYKQKVEEQERKRLLVAQQYFTCLKCGQINLVEDIKNEESENRTMRAHYTTWKKLKELANEKGGYMEGAIL